MGLFFFLLKASSRLSFLTNVHIIKQYLQVGCQFENIKFKFWIESAVTYFVTYFGQQLKDDESVLFLVE